jgi:hypothetical protein
MRFEMKLTGKIGTLTLVLGLDGDNATTTGGSLSPDTAEQTALAQINRSDNVVKRIFWIVNVFVRGNLY